MAPVDSYRKLQQRPGSLYQRYLLLNPLPRLSLPAAWLDLAGEYVAATPPLGVLRVCAGGPHAAGNPCSHSPSTSSAGRWPREDQGALSVVIILFPFPVPGVNPFSHSCFLLLPWERLREGQESWESQAKA